ncbi:MAG: hypothetical protein V3R89_07210, partial [Thermoanaerobaculia bacterium]
KKYLRFVDPRDEAWFQAVAQAVRDLPLDVATRAVAAGHLVDEASGAAVPWRPMPVVLPTSQELRKRVSGDPYRQRVVEARPEFSFRRAGAS